MNVIICNCIRFLFLVRFLDIQLVLEHLLFDLVCNIWQSYGFLFRISAAEILDSHRLSVSSKG